MNVRPAASTIVGAWVSTELTVSATASAANADVAPAKLLDAGVAATPLTVIDQMRSGDSSGEEWLATVLLGCAALCVFGLGENEDLAADCGAWAGGAWSQSPGQPLVGAQPPEMSIA